MSIRVRELFPTLVGQGTLRGFEALNAALTKDIRNLSRQDKLGQSWSDENYPGGYTSYASLSDLHHRTRSFSDFQERMQPEVEAFAAAQRWEMRKMTLRMTECWMNIMPRHTYHSLHLHPHSVVSGAYYVNAPAKSVGIKLEDPRMGLYMNAPTRKSSRDGHGLFVEIPPTAGSFVLFESWLRHEVPPNRSTQPRISISFNYTLEPDEED